MGEIDILSKESIKTDLALIWACLRLINQTIALSKQNGETFTASENEEIHMAPSHARIVSSVFFCIYEYTHYLVERTTTNVV